METACIVLPTYNERENIAQVIPWIFAQADKIASHELHVLVVDDNSPDGTQEVVKQCMQRFSNLHLISGEKQGLGAAYKRGFAYAMQTLDLDLLFEMDADLQHSPELLPLFVTLANHGFSLVIGSRFCAGGSTPDFSLRRKLLSLLGNWSVRFFGGLPRIRDCTSGYRCIKAELVRQCDLSFVSSRGYAFQVLLLCELLRHGAQVIEVPIVFHDRLYGQSKLALRDQIGFLGNIARIRFRQSDEFIKFCLVGLAGVLVNMGTYVLLTRLLDMALEIASPLAIEVSIVSNFVLNDGWTFRHRETENNWVQKFYRFHIVASLAALVNYGVLLLSVNALGLWDITGNLLGITVGALLNYCMNSLWTWKKQRLVTPEEK